MKTCNLLLALFLLVGLGSCGSDDDGNESAETNRIVGEWKIQSLTIDGESVLITDCEAQSGISFNANGSFTSTDFFEDETEECISEDSNGNWEYRGNNVYRFTEASETYDIPIMFSDNNNRFTITEEDESGTYSLIYVKV